MRSCDRALKYGAGDARDRLKYGASEPGSILRGSDGRISTRCAGNAGG